MALFDNLKRGWNAFVGRDPTVTYRERYGPGNYIHPARMQYTRGNERSTVSAIYNRLAIDVASIEIEHVRLDKNNRYLETMDSGLNACLTLEANIDQTGRAFIQDVCQTMFDDGYVAVLPVDTDIDPMDTSAFDILSLRVGRIKTWYPRAVRIEAYDERTGMKREIVMPKSKVAIIENPFFSVMNEQNSTTQRLIRKLNMLDVVDEQAGSGKLDMIIQLPYAVKTEARREQARLRKKDLEDQLSNSKYGIAYVDSTEKITQLNRAVENNIMEEVKYLQDMLFSQLGLTMEIMNGTASPEDMQNYYTRTIEPILSAIVDEFRRKFLSKTARTQRQSILFFRNPLKLVSTAQVADIADKFTRNEIVSTNEMRQAVGFKPVQDEMADQLRNKNLSPGVGQEYVTTDNTRSTAGGEEAPSQEDESYETDSGSEFVNRMRDQRV